VRVVLNRIYAYLIAGADEEGRERFEADLYAPMEGWSAAEAALWQAIDEAAEGGG
jgi:hypothetical protein